MVAEGYFIEQAIHTLICTTLVVLATLQFIVDRKVSAAEKQGLTTAHIGKVQYWFHRNVLVVCIGMLIKCVDPMAVDGIYNEAFVNWIHQFVSAILIDSAFLLVFWTIDGTYVAFGLNERTPAKVKSVFFGLMIGTVISANGSMLIRVLTSNLAWSYGLNDMWFAFTEIVAFTLLAIGIRLLIKVITGYNSTTMASASVAHAMLKLKRMLLALFIICVICVFFQVWEMSELASAPYDNIYNLNPNSYEVSNFTYFSFTIYLASGLFMWYAWLPLGILTVDGFSSLLKNGMPAKVRQETNSKGTKSWTGRDDTTKSQSPPGSPRASTLATPNFKARQYSTDSQVPALPPFPQTPRGGIAVSSTTLPPYCLPDISSEKSTDSLV